MNIGECAEASDGGETCKADSSIDSSGKGSDTWHHYDKEGNKIPGETTCTYQSDGEGGYVGGIDNYNCDATLTDGDNSLSISYSGGRGDSSDSSNAKPGFNGHQILSAYNGTTASNIIGTTKDVVDIIKDSAEVFDVQHQTSIAKKVSKLSFIDYVSPYEPDSPFVSNGVFTAAKIASGVSKATGINVGIEIAKEIAKNGLDGTRVTSSATVALFDTLLTTAVAGSAALLVAGAISAPAAAVVFAAVSVAFAIESLVDGPYSGFKTKLINSIDKNLSGIDSTSKTMLLADIDELSTAFEGGIEVAKTSDKANVTDLNKLSNDVNKSRIVDAQSGDDKIIASKAKDIIVGGEGVDTVDYHRSEKAIDVNLMNSEGKGGDAEGDIIYEIENVIATRFNDKIIGSNAGNTIESGYGNDTVITGDGNDHIDAGSGSDSINTGIGNDVVEAGSGSDSIDTGDGNDIIYSGGKPSSNATTVVYSGKTMNGYESESDVINSGNGNDIIVAGENDFVIGGNGYDKVILDKSRFSGYKASVSKINHNGNSYNKYSFSNATVNISQSVEKISLHDKEYFKKSHNVGRWTYDLKTNGSISSKYWTQESSRYNNSPLIVEKSKSDALGARFVIDFNNDGVINNYSEFRFDAHESFDSNRDGIVNSSDKLFNKLGYLKNGSFTSLESLGVDFVNFTKLTERANYNSNPYNTGVSIFTNPGSSIFEGGNPLHDKFRFTIHNKNGTVDTILDHEAKVEYEKWLNDQVNNIENKSALENQLKYGGITSEIGIGGRFGYGTSGQLSQSAKLSEAMSSFGSKSPVSSMTPVYQNKVYSSATSLVAVSNF